MSLPEILRRPLTLPVVASPMFIASGPDLVVAQCQAGVVGSFPALNARPATKLDDWLAEIGERTAGAAPFAVNQIVHKTNDRLDHDLAACVKHQVPIVICSLGAREDVYEAVHSYGGIVLHDIINDRFAHKAVEKGADGLIAVAAGAGGHAGVLSPFALIREIRQWFDGPLLLSGAMAHGRSILAAQVAGADLAYVGSAFLATHEANVIDDYKDMVVASRADDIVYSSLFSGVKGNYLKGSIAKAGYDPDNLPDGSPSKMTFASEDEKAVDEAAAGQQLHEQSPAKAWRDIWGAGQGIADVDRRLSTAELVAQFKAQYDEALASPVWTGRGEAALTGG